MVELDVDLIDEGRMRTQLHQSLKRALRDLLAYEKESMDRDGSAEVTLKIKMGRTKGSSEFFDVEYGTSVKVPNVVRGTSVKEVGGRLLCQPSGSNEDNPEQQLFYDAKGRIIGGVDPDTGEEQQQIVGRIG